MGQAVLFLQRHTGGMLRAADYSLFSFCWLLGTVTRWRAAKPTDITDSSSLPPSLSFSLSLSCIFLHFTRPPREKGFLLTPQFLEAHAESSHTDIKQHKHTFSHTRVHMMIHLHMISYI